MNIDDYLTALDRKLHEMSGVIMSTTIRREIDANIGLGFIKGVIVFIDGSRLEFSEQLPTERRKYRLHYMDTNNNLIVRWDSAPHHHDLSTFPFHKHTPRGPESCGPVSMLNVLDEVASMIRG